MSQGSLILSDKASIKKADDIVFDCMNKVMDGRRLKKIRKDYYDEYIENGLKLNAIGSPN